MLILILGLLLFLGIHSMQIISPGTRAAVVARRGEGAWKWPYVAVSIIGFVFIIYGYGWARQNPLVVYTPPAGLRHLALLVLLPVFPLLFATYMPGRIKSAVKHPMLIATVLWALAHLMANGSLADILLFGGFLVWALADLGSVLRRPAKPIPALKPSRFNDAIAVVAGLLVYGAFIGGLHYWLFGVAPIGVAPT
jgi:uncharacterized membrane protein